MTDKETPASSNSDETTRAQTTTEALEWHAPVMVRIDEHTTIPHLLKERVQRGATRPLILRKVGIGDTWRSISARDFYDEVQSVAAGLMARGLEPGDRVAIMSRTRYEWTLLDFACWRALCPVPIYETSSIDQVAHVLVDADVNLIVTETVSMAEIVRAAAERENRDNTHVLSLDSEAIDTLIADGATVPRDRVLARSDALTKDDIATIVYTSGTTGTPKGTVLSHENFTNLCVNAHVWMPEIAAHKNSRLLLFLPLAHVFARFLQVFQISGNGVLGHAPNIKNLLPDLASFRPSYLLVVPRVLEKIYNSADTKARGPKQKIFRWAAKVAIAYSQALDTEEGPSVSLEAQHMLADRLVYQQIIRLVGGNADYIVSGGAPLATWLAHFYRGVGIPVLEGYGLTETVGPVSVNTPRLSKIGTVGPALPPMSFKISDEGEILLKGPSVFQRYHNDPEATAACFTEDGWFRTGDLGSLDRDGYVSITGRAKEIIVTAGGKNVAPATLETRCAPTRSSPRSWSWAIRGRSWPRSSRWTRRCCPIGSPPTRCPDERGRGGLERRGPGLPAKGGGLRERARVARRVDPKDQGPHDRLHGGQWSAHALPEGQAPGSHAPPRADHRRDLRRPRAELTHAQSACT